MRTRLCACLLLVPALAFASGQSNSGDSSQNSGNSSQNSGGSSDGSGNSSQQSGNGSQGTSDSSETSNATSENTSGSSNNSESESSRTSSEAASSQVVAVASALATVGATVYAGFLLVNATVMNLQQPYADVRMLRYLKEHHALVSRDVIEGDGVILEGWYVALGLTAEERTLMRDAFDGTDAQAAMLAALDGVSTVDQARRFAGAFVAALHTTLGDARTSAIIEAAAHRQS